MTHRTTPFSILLKGEALDNLDGYCLQKGHEISSEGEGKSKENKRKGFLAM
jgi:hypothetical protein